MKLHVWVGAVTALVVAMFVQSCGAGRCTPQSCPNGCCDTTGMCQLGSTPNACGRSGALCTACTLGFSCVGGSCTSLGTGAGTSGMGGGSSFGGGSPGGGTTAGGTAGGMSAGGGTAGGMSAGGSTAGGTTAGGTSGGMATAGGTAGGAGVGGGAAGGMTFGQQCMINAPNCPTGSACVVTNTATTATTCTAGCNPVDDNCPNSSDRCGYYNIGGVTQRTCGLIPQNAQLEGQPCDPVQNNCVAEHYCITEPLGSFCRKTCALRPNDCPANQICNNIVPVSGTRENLVLCEPPIACNLVTQSPCANTPGRGCVNGTGTGPICSFVGTVPVGQTCSNMAPCQRGSVCILASAGATTGTCRSWCTLGQSCISGTCTALTNTPPNIGACL